MARRNVALDSADFFWRVREVSFQQEGLPPRISMYQVYRGSTIHPEGCFIISRYRDASRYTQESAMQAAIHLAAELNLKEAPDAAVDLPNWLILNMDKPEPKMPAWQLES